MTAEHDERLREAFHVLRRDTAASAPEFRDTLARIGRWRERIGRVRRRAAIVALAAAAAGLVVIAVVRPFGEGNRSAVVDLTATRWEAPTDFLLRTPGAELLRTMPTFTINRRITP